MALTPEQVQSYRTQYKLDTPTSKANLPTTKTPTPQTKGMPDWYLQTRSAPVNPAPTQTPAPKSKSVFQKLSDFGQGAQDLAVGAAKGAVSTVKGAADLGEDIFRPLTDRIADAIVPPKVNLPRTKSSDIIPKSLYTPKNKTESVGKGIEQTAELFTPVGVEEKGLSTTAKVVKGALEFGGKTAIQTGGDKKQTAIAAATGGGTELLSAGVSKLLQNIPENAWSGILKRTPTEVAKNPNLPAKAAETGLIGTRNQIIAKSQNHIQQIEVALDDLLKGSDQKIGTLKIAPYLDELRNSYKNIPGEQGSVDTINNVMKDLLKQKTMTPLEANAMKRDIYGLISKSYGKGTLEVSAKTEAQKQIARGLKGEIEKVIPEAKTLNEQQAVYIQINKALNKLAARGEGKGVAGTGIGLYDLMTGGFGEIAGVASGHPIIGLAPVVVKKVGESAPFLSSAAKLAKYFDNLSPTKKLLFQKAIQVLSVQGGRQAIPSK